VTRHEHVYEQLVKEFGGNKELFFSFFTVVDTDPTVLRPYRKIAEAIPWMQKDIKAEWDQSGSLWEQQWAGKNGWEVWRALGKEWY
jgi:hypothetical protein